MHKAFSKYERSETTSCNVHMSSTLNRTGHTRMIVKSCAKKNVTLTLKGKQLSCCAWAEKNIFIVFITLYAFRKVILLRERYRVPFIFHAYVSCVWCANRPNTLKAKHFTLMCRLKNPQRKMFRTTFHCRWSRCCRWLCM